MKLKSSLWSSLFIVSALGLALNAVADDEPTYKLLPGDKVAISVWGEETLNLKDIVVLPDGSISFPLAGGLKVSGLTTKEVEKQLAERLKTYLPEPQVTLVVTSIEGNRAYVVGKVSKPGPVLINSPMTVLQALSMAGVLDKFADESAIKVLRQTDKGTQVFSVKYNSLLKGQSLDANILLQPGDTVVVP